MPSLKVSMGRPPSHGGYHMSSGKGGGSSQQYKVVTTNGLTSLDSRFQR